MMKASFIKKRKDAEYQTWPLMIEEELAKAQARAEIYENESKIGQNRKTKPSMLNDVPTNQGISTTENLDETKQKKVQNKKWKRMFKTHQKSEPSYLAIIPDADSRKNMRKSYPSWSNGDEEGVSYSSSAQTVYFKEDNGHCEDNKIQKDPVVGLQNNIAEMLCKLVKEQSAPQVALEPFDGNPLEYKYFMSMFRESVKKKIEDPKGKLIRLIEYTTGEAKDLIKNFINDRPEYGVQICFGSSPKAEWKPTHFAVIIVKRGETDGTFKNWGCNSLQETI